MDQEGQATGDRPQETENQRQLRCPPDQHAGSCRGESSAAKIRAASRQGNPWFRPFGHQGAFQGDGPHPFLMADEEGNETRAADDHRAVQ